MYPTKEHHYDKNGVRTAIKLSLSSKSSFKTDIIPSCYVKDPYELQILTCSLRRR